MNTNRWCSNRKSFSGDVTGIVMESYKEEFVLNPNNNEFLPALWKSEVDDVYCLSQHGQENIQKFLDFMNSRHSWINWTVEVEKKGALAFVDLSLNRKESHTFKYSTFSSNRPRAEQLGNYKVYAPHGNNLQKGVNQPCNNLCLMVNPKWQRGKRMYATRDAALTVLSVTLEKLHSGGTNKKNSTSNA